MQLATKNKPAYHPLELKYGSTDPDSPNFGDPPAPADQPAKKGKKVKFIKNNFALPKIVQARKAEPSFLDNVSGMIAKVKESPKDWSVSQILEGYADCVSKAVSA